MVNELKKVTKLEQTTGEWMPIIGETVRIPWGIDEIFGKAAEIYGNRPRVQVVVELIPELSGHVVDEPTTVTFPIDLVRKA
jgi:hypothetical protein